MTSTRTALAAAAVLLAAPAAAAPTGGLSYRVTEGLNENAFVQDGPVAAHLLLRSGAAPRILVAFPAADSGVGLWFKPGGRAVAWRLTGDPRPLVRPDARGRPLYGVVAEADVRAPSLTIRKAVLSSVRVLRDYQGGALISESLAVAPHVGGDTVSWTRDRLDGAAGYVLSVQVIHGTLDGDRLVAGRDGRIGVRITALSGETPLTPFAADALLDAHVAPDPAARNALRFLSYREKLLAGSWRFNTYFGRDTLMSVRLLMPVLTPEAVETGLGAVLDRLSPRGEVAHEEAIGEFAVLEHLTKEGVRSDAPVCDYAMVDSSYLLAPVAGAWLLDDPRARTRAEPFLEVAGSGCGGPSRRRGEALVANLRFVVRSAAAFAAAPSAENLISLKPGHDTGEWRDSDTGLGGGRHPYDVNAVLAPAALEAVARLYASGLLRPYLDDPDRALFARAAAMAQTWRRRAPGFFTVEVAPAEAAREVAAYAATSAVPARPALEALGGRGVRFHALSLDAAGRPIAVMNSDLGFELLFGRPADTDAMAAEVDALLRPFPAGLLTDVGMVVADAAYAPLALQASFSRNAYHGAVVWSWQQAMFAAGLERQLGRTDLTPSARARLTAAQARLWKAIQATPEMNNSELWSWRHDDGRYHVAAFGASGGDVDESNAAQLWSTVYLAVRPPAHLR